MEIFFIIKILPAIKHTCKLGFRFGFVLANNSCIMKTSEIKDNERS